MTSDVDEPVLDEAWVDIARRQETNPYYPFLTTPDEALAAGVPVDYVRVCNTGCAKDAPSLVAFWKAGVPAEWVKKVVPARHDRVEHYISAWAVGADAAFLRKLSFLVMPARIRLWTRGLRVHHIIDLGIMCTLPDALEAAALGFPAKELAIYLEAGFDVEGAALMHDAGVTPEYAAGCGGQWNSREVVKLYEYGIPEGYAGEFGPRAKFCDVAQAWDEGIPVEYVQAMR